MLTTALRSGHPVYRAAIDARLYVLLLWLPNSGTSVKYITSACSPPRVSMWRNDRIPAASPNPMKNSVVTRLDPTATPQHRLPRAALAWFAAHRRPRTLAALRPKLGLNVAKDDLSAKQ